jgi:uncharacterized phage-associated protein
MGVQFKFDFERFLAVLQYMAWKSVPELDKYKIGKLLFLADKYHLVQYGRPIIGDCYYALKYGPVPSHALDLLNGAIRSEGIEKDGQIRALVEGLEIDRRYHYPRFSRKNSPAFHALSKSDVMALDHIIEKFGSKDFNSLKSLTHTMFAYRNTWDAAPNTAMQYEDFFEEDPDAIEGAREEMLENYELSSAFPSSDEL